jgi:hypothetical protein
MSDRHYFINCRGADFFPTYESTWEKSGHIPTTVRNLFQGLTSSMDSAALMFNGSTRISTWVHFNEKEVSDQIRLLKSAGINLLRIHLDLYCWASMGDKFIQRIKTMGRLAQDNKMYVQWVLFEADTPDDFPGKDTKGRYHEIGGYDPQNLEDAMINGLHHYQRCPTVYNDHFLTRHPSSMVVSGNTYIEDVVEALSGYKSTLTWEVMANVGFDSVLNPADVSAYNFLASAISKTNSLIPAHQNVTTSFKKVSVPVTATLSPIDLYFIIGDEHARGGGNILQVTGMGYTAGAVEDVYIFQPSASFWSRDATGQFQNISVIGDRTTLTVPKFEQLIVEENTSPVLGIRGVGFGTEILFGKDLKTFHGRPAFIVKMGKDGAAPASTPLTYASVADPYIYATSINDWDTYNDKIYYKFINWLGSSIDVLEKQYGKNRIVFRAGLIFLGTNNPDTGGESVPQICERVGKNYRRLIEGIRNYFKVRKIGSENSRMITVLPDSRYAGNYYSGIRNYISALGSYVPSVSTLGDPDPNILTYDPPSSIVTFKGGGDNINYSSSSLMYIASSTANLIKALPVQGISTYPISSIYNQLDYICYKGSNGGFIDRLVNYLDALSACVSVNKPLMVIDATLASKLNHLHTEVSSFSSLQVGFITDSMIDRNISIKPNNLSRGIFYADGTARDARYVSALQLKALSDLKSLDPNTYGRKKIQSVLFPNTITEKTNYELNTLANATYSASSMTRLSQWGTEGEDFFEYMQTMFYALPHLNSIDTSFNPYPGTPLPIGTKYAPFGNSDYAKSLGYDISNKNYYIDKNDITKNNSSEFLISIDKYFNTGHASFSNYALDNTVFSFLNSVYLSARPGDYLRDKLCYFKINLLEELQRALPISSFNDSINPVTYPTIVSGINLQNLLKSYEPFAPQSNIKSSVSSVNPIIGTPKYLSGTQYYGYTQPYSVASQYIRPFLADLSSCQKPACYYLRGPGFLSGSCYYKAGASVDPEVSSTQNVLDKIDWAKYDTAIFNWYAQIKNCWALITSEYPAYLTTLNGIISSAFANSESTNNPNPTLPNLSGVI